MFYTFLLNMFIPPAVGLTSAASIHVATFQYLERELSLNCGTNGADADRFTHKIFLLFTYIR